MQTEKTVFSQRLSEVPDPENNLPTLGQTLTDIFGPFVKYGVLLRPE